MCSSGSGSLTNQQMIRYKSLHVDHSRRIPLCVEANPGQPQKTYTSAWTHTVILCRFLNIWYLVLVLNSRVQFHLCCIQSVCLLSSSVNSACATLFQALSPPVKHFLMIYSYWGWKHVLTLSLHVCFLLFFENSFMCDIREYCFIKQTLP